MRELGYVEFAFQRVGGVVRVISVSRVEFFFYIAEGGRE